MPSLSQPPSPKGDFTSPVPPNLCLSAEVRAGSEQAAHMWTCVWEGIHTVINTSKHCKGEMLDGRVNLVILMKYTNKTVSLLSSMTLSNNANDSFFDQDVKAFSYAFTFHMHLHFLCFSFLKECLF